MVCADDTFFIADCHLHGSRPAMSDLFVRFTHAIHGAGRLWVLGDFVDYWLGDDLGNPDLAPVFTALLRLSDSGTCIDFMLGNRDFLLGDTFAASVGATVHTDDELIIELPDGERALAMHGDTLCTDDADYQTLRAVLRSPSWQRDFLKKSAVDRVATAESLRHTSRSASAGKQQHIMDVNAEAVTQALTRHSLSTLIHGHTHRPDRHEFSTEAGAGERCTRWVLGDWHDDHAMVAHANPSGVQLKRLTLASPEGCAILGE